MGFGAYGPSGVLGAEPLAFYNNSMKHFLAAILLLLTTPLHAEQPWERLPPTPILPHPTTTGLAPVNGIRLWYATFGSSGANATPVVLLHGGLANADYWGNLIPQLTQDREVIVLDSRGHGRSSRNATQIGYELMASDVLALLDRLKIQKAAIVGWSDGAITGLEIAIHHPERLTALFAFAANSDPSGVKDVRNSPVFTEFIARAAHEYAHLNPTGFPASDADIERMWAREPNFSQATLRGITARIWIVDADHDEAITRENTDHMAALIPNARELILPGVSHFAFLQDPAMFAFAVRHFLAAP
jgi:pimeloyl-ACP methyl ester carboxylesterase